MKDLRGNKRSAEGDVSPTGRRARPVELRHSGLVSQRDEVGRSTRPPITKAGHSKTTDPQTPKTSLSSQQLRECHRAMRTEPLIELTAYDICDDTDCGCETCQTPWGTEIPTLGMKA